MNDVVLNMKVPEENLLLFKRCIRQLLESTFILREKDERLYAFASRAANRQDIQEYLHLMAFDMVVDETLGVCMLVQNENDKEEIGLKRANIVTLNNLQYHILLVLWKIYLEMFSTNEEVYTTKGDVIDKLKSYGVMPLKTDLKKALDVFKKYRLINFIDDDSGENMKIELYPSLQFGWDTKQFETNVNTYLNREKAESEEAEGDTQNDDDEMEEEA